MGALSRWGSSSFPPPGAPVPNTNTPSATSLSTSPSSQITSRPNDTLLFLGASPSSANILNLKTSSSPPSQAQRLVSSLSTLGGVASLPLPVPLPYPLLYPPQPHATSTYASNSPSPSSTTPTVDHPTSSSSFRGSGQCTNESTGFECGFVNGWCGVVVVVFRVGLGLGWTMAVKRSTYGQRCRFQNYENTNNGITFFKERKK